MFQGFFNSTRISLLLRLASLVLCLPALSFAQSSVVVTEHVRAELIAHAPDGVAAGRSVRLGLSIQHQPHWHTYWKNPGDSGLATTLSWQLPDGVNAGDIEWPTPKQLPVGPLMNYGYEGLVLLPVTLAAPEGFSARTLNVKLRADWLVCKDICIPESGEFSLQVPVDRPTRAHESAFTAAQSVVPGSFPSMRATGRVDGETLIVEVDGLPTSLQGKNLSFLPEMAGVIDHAGLIEQKWVGARWMAKVPASGQRSESPAVMAAVLSEVGEPATGVRVKMAIAGSWSGPALPMPNEGAAPSGSSSSAASFGLTIGLALLGGLLLNLMPCVFPVLSLKVLGFAQPGQNRRTLATSGLAYTGGVVVSFVVLAGLLLALRAGGEKLGWGFQLQSPMFVALLAIVFTLIGLNLAGLFEFGSVLPSGLASLRARHPVADHALTGVLAVAVASPCTGPFMGVALGAALTLPAVQALMVFAALGLGMASPYLAASLLPGLARRLPRPGVWMLRFKVLMAFPMFATVVWLLWVLGQQVGIDGAAALLAVLVALAFAAWAIGSPGFGRKGRLGFGAAALVTLGATALWAWPSLHPTAMATGTAPAASPWRPWSKAAVVRAQAEGQLVFVDFTAAWCVTCQVNKRTTLSDPAVLADFARRQVLLLRADWTRRDPEITQELGRLGRSGVPAYALYTPSASAPRMLSEILSPDEVQHALADISPARISEPTPTVSTTRSQ